MPSASPHVSAFAQSASGNRRYLVIAPGSSEQLGSPCNYKCLEVIATAHEEWKGKTNPNIAKLTRMRRIHVMFGHPHLVS